jgi:glutamate-1-semialdehyde 2,1-aminomutase
VGCDALKREAARVFHSGSFWYTAGALAAAIACIEELKAIDAPAILRKQGRKLLDGMIQLSEDAGLNLLVSGEPAMPSLRLTNDPSLMLHQRFCGECTRRGAFFTSHHNWFLSTAHSDDDIQRTLDIVEESLKAIRSSADGLDFPPS